MHICEKEDGTFVGVACKGLTGRAQSIEDLSADFMEKQFTAARREGRDSLAGYIQAKMYWKSRIGGMIFEKVYFKK